MLEAINELENIEITKNDMDIYKMECIDGKVKKDIQTIQDRENNKHY